MSISLQTRARLRARYLANLPLRFIAICGVRSRLEAGEPTAAADARTLGHQFSGTGASFGVPELSLVGHALEQAADEELEEALGRLMETVRAILLRDAGFAAPEP